MLPKGQVETSRDRRTALFGTLAERRMTNHKRNEDIVEEKGILLYVPENCIDLSHDSQNSQ